MDGLKREEPGKGRTCPFPPRLEDVDAGVHARQLFTLLVVELFPHKKTAFP
ncbi:hypothetical protein [Paracoccus fontiphilus]|uniref:Uncharacterized protein n=1 Tax=Paracoccus fontiphilus TaxID=1815556 RepID=A0ABV7IIJ3_9RHOB|nr:hypothetical protein [Paracoccus fontiphilus]